MSYESYEWIEPIFQYVAPVHGKKETHDGSIGTNGIFYLHEIEVDFDGVHVGKYMDPMDPSWERDKTLSNSLMCECHLMANFPKA